MTGERTDQSRAVGFAAPAGGAPDGRPLGPARGRLHSRPQAGNQPRGSAAVARSFTGAGDPRGIACAWGHGYRCSAPGFAHSIDGGAPDPVVPVRLDGFTEHPSGVVGRQCEGPQLQESGISDVRGDIRDPQGVARALVADALTGVSAVPCGFSRKALPLPQPHDEPIWTTRPLRAVHVPSQSHPEPASVVPLALRSGSREAVPGPVGVRRVERAGREAAVHGAVHHRTVWNPDRHRSCGHHAALLRDVICRQQPVRNSILVPRQSQTPRAGTLRFGHHHFKTYIGKQSNVTA